MTRPLPPEPSTALEHQIAPPRQRVLADRVVHQVHRLDVVEDRVLTQVVADHCRHVGVDELVVGHAVAHAVGDRHASRPGRVHDAGAAHQRFGPELQRVEELVVDAAVDHVHGDLALRRAQEHVGAVAHEVAALHQVHAHEAGEERVLVEGRVVHPRRQDDDGRVLHGRWRGPAQRVDQVGRVVRDHLDRLAPEQLRQHPGHGGAVGQDVAHARRAAQVVLEDAELPVLVADHVDPGHVDAHAVGRRVPVGGPHEARGAGDDLVGDETVADDARRAVDVSQEVLERPDPLHHPGGHPGPLRGGEDARHYVEGERSLLAVEVEGDALVHEGTGQPGGAGRDVLGSHLGQGGGHRGVGHPGLAVPPDHLVEGDLGQPVRGQRRSRRRGLPRLSGCQPCVSRWFHGCEQPVTTGGRAGRGDQA